MLKRTGFFLMLSCAALSAADNPPSESSIRQLLEVTDVKNLLNNMMTQMDMMLQKSLREAMSGQEMSPEVQKMVDRSRNEMLAVLKDELSWEKLEPLYLRVYQKSLSQEEVDGMLGFYKTPTGQAVIHKMPVILQNTMAEMQTRMAPIMQRIQQSQQKLLADIKKKKKAHP